LTGARRSIWLYEDQWQQLNKIGERDDRSVNWLVRQAVELYLQDQQVVDEITIPTVFQPQVVRAEEDGPAAPAPPARGDDSAGSDPQKLIEQEPDATAIVPPNAKDHFGAPKPAPKPRTRKR
jgi:hypothetical protein